MHQRGQHLDYKKTVNQNNTVSRISKNQDKVFGLQKDNTKIIAHC